MKMTPKEVAALLWNMNKDCSNVELYRPEANSWHLVETLSVSDILEFISHGSIYRIKDNSLKELSLNLYKEVFKRIGSEGYTANIQNIDFDKNRVWIDGGWNSLESLNKHWQMAEN